MRRTLMLGLLLSVIVCSVSLADAFQVCWRLHDGADTPLLDVLHMAADREPGTNIFKLHGDVDADPVYQQGATGTAIPKSDDGSFFRVALTAVHNTSAFGGNWSCALTLLIVADQNAEDFLDGTWQEQCAGGSTVHIPVAGFVHSFTCASVIAVAEPEGHVSVQQETIFGKKRPLKPGLAQEDVLAQQMNAFGEERAAGKGNFVSLPQP